MELSTGLTWQDAIDQINADENFKASLAIHNRRSRKALRARGEQEERKVWRLIIQHDRKNFVKTAFRKNIRTEDEALLSQTVEGKILDQVNAVLAK